MQRLHARSFIMAAMAMALTTSAGAQVSPVDVQRADAAAAFGLRLDALRALRAQTAEEFQKYERACRGKVTTGRAAGAAFLRADVVWFAERLEIDNESTAACRMLVTDITTHSRQTKRDLERIDEAGRRRGIYPGVMRDLKRSYGFE